jgi:mediator of RNA polymerase II transcription subunit 6
MANQGEIQLSISVHMQAFLDTASQHVHWTPSTGPSYLPPHLNDSSTTSSKPSDSQSQSQFQPQTTTNGLTNASLFHSLHLTNQYGHEYADENPLQGEPGAFVFASTTQQVEARNKAQAAAQTAAQAQIAGGNTATLPLGLPPANAKTEGGGASANASAVNSVAATPRPLEGMASRKGSLVGVPAPPKVKRRKRPGSLPGPP